MHKANIVLAVNPWFRGDIARVNEIIEDAGLDEACLAEYIQAQWRETSNDWGEIDPVAETYQFILDHAVAVERTAYPDQSFLEEKLWVAGDHLAASFDYRKEDEKRIASRLQDLKDRLNDGIIQWLGWETGLSRP